VNLSENFINILLIKIFRFYNKFKARNNTNKNEEIVQKEIILKYKIYNYTNIDFEITYQNCNYKLKNSDKVYLDFQEEEDVASNLNNYILLSAGNNNKKILLFPENIGIKKYKLSSNETEREIYIETKIRQYKHIDIKIYNYTNIDFEITYQNCNYKLKNSDKVYLDFQEEEDIESNLNNYILLSAGNNNKKILLFPENIGIKKYKLSLNETEREIYIETKIRQYKHIDIKIYNPIIIKNKTNHCFKISLNEKNNNNNNEQLKFESYSTLNLPDDLNTNGSINLFLDSDDENKENMINININEIIPKAQDKKMSKEIIFKNKNIFFSLVSKIKSDNLLILTIIYKYCIINCLPCSLFISKNAKQTNEGENNENTEIAKNSLFNIDNASIFTQSNSIFLKIKIQDKYYISKLSLLRNETKTKLISFVNSTNDKHIIFQIIIKETYKNKAMIIYSENILYNNSGIDLNIFTQDENNNNYIYNIGKNLYIISSEIKKSNSFICIKSSKNVFIAKYLKYEDIEKIILSGFSLNFEGKNDIFSFELIMDKNISNLYCENDKNNFLYKINEKNENKVIIYSIVPKYNIINLTEKKNKNNDINLILKHNHKYFLGININSIEEIKDKNNHCIIYWKI
jgi:hypothetical protein